MTRLHADFPTNVLHRRFRHHRSSRRHENYDEEKNRPCNSLTFWLNHRKDFGGWGRSKGNPNSGEKMPDVRLDCSHLSSRFTRLTLNESLQNFRGSNSPQTPTR
jgi:hypothetical protein